MEIGDRCDIAPGVRFMCGGHRIGAHERRAGFGFVDSIVVGPGSWIGVAAALLPGARLGPGTLVTSGAVVTKGDYPSNATLAGVRARVVKGCGE